MRQAKTETVRGFSLVEVVIAVGIFGTAIAAILGLLPSLTRQTSDSSAMFSAQNLPGPLRIELERAAIAAGFDSLAGSIPTMGAPLQDGFSLVGTRDGSRVAVATNGNSSIAADEQYFFVEVWRFADGALVFTGASATLALHVRVSWPYRLSGVANPLAPGDRSQFTFVISINR